MKRKTTITASLSALGLIIVVGLGKYAGREAMREYGHEAGRQAAINQVASDAASSGAPVGLLGAKWLMSMDEVRRIRPEVALGEPSQLIEVADAFGRMASIMYSFEDDALLLIVVSFLDSAAPTFMRNYDSTQELLTSQFGSLSEPLPTSDYRLRSTRTIGRFAVAHLLSEPQGYRVEQVLMYRTGG
jgi:hypothetical protein